jgi:hypothetical protein
MEKVKEEIKEEAVYKGRENTTRRRKNKGKSKEQ